MSEKMKSLSLEEVVAILSDMKIDIPVPKAAVTQRKRNAALDMAISALSCSEIPNSSDLISRRVVLDMLHRECSTAVEEFLVDKINALPSVQSDEIPLEWVNKHLEWLDNCDNDFAQLAKISIRAMVEIWKKNRI